MEVTRLEIGDLVWDKSSNMFGVVIERGGYETKVLWNDGVKCWERVGEFKIDEDKKIPFIYSMPY